jgi:tetratricopeptide (TPR) repeat protein
LTGVKPFAGQDLDEVIEAVQQGNVPAPRRINSRIPKPLEAICKKAMALEPRGRYSSALALAEDIEHYLADESVSAYRESFAEHARRWRRRHRAVVAATSFAIFLGLIGFIIATVLLTAAHSRERIARTDAEEQLGRALENYRLAREAVDKLHTEVSENQFLHLPGFQPLRQELLRSAQEFYLKLAQKEPEDTAVTADHARALYRLASISADTRGARDALSLLQGALAGLNALPEHAQAECRHDVGLCWHALAISYHQNGQPRSAEGSFQQALSVQDELLAKKPGDAQLRRERRNTCSALAVLYHETGQPQEAEAMYKDSIRLGEELLAEDSEKHGLLRLTLLDTYVNLGNLLRDAGKFPEADESYRQGLDQADLLVSSMPGVPPLESKKASALSARSLGHYMARQPAAAEAGLREAAALQKKLAEENPSVHGYREQWAITLTNLANVQADQGHAARALAAYQQSFKLFAEIAERVPENADYQNNLAASSLNLGTLYFLLGDAERAEAAFLLAIRIREPLVDARGSPLRYAAQLGSAYLNMGFLSHARGDQEKALGWFDKAKEILESVLQKEPRHREGLDFLPKAYAGQGQSLASLGRHADAIKAYDRALELVPSKSQAQYRLFRAGSQAHLRDHVAATKEADNALSQLPADGDALYPAARVYATSANAVSQDTRLSEEERKAKSEQYASKAVELLGKAEESGLFKNPQAAKNLQEDADLKPLRERRDYKALLQKITK